MKKLLLIALLSTTSVFSNINVIVSIIPQKTFLQAIGKEKINITLMVQAGNSPHTYEPKPSQMLSVSKADLYLSMGVEFEKVWLPKFHDLNSKMHIVDLSQGIQKLPMQHDAHHGKAKIAHERLDPHTWTSPQNVKIIANNIYKALVKQDAKNSAYYRKNLEDFLRKIDLLDKNITHILAPLKNERTFMVFHPSWGYFAHSYNLKQIAVEVSGKTPKPRELVSLIRTAKSAHVHAIFTQPEFSDNSAKIIAKELHIPVVKISPMAKDWAKNLLFMAQTIAGKK
jgi:zinc transport system substrate-binding protein